MKPALCCCIYGNIWLSVWFGQATRRDSLNLWSCWESKVLPRSNEHSLRRLERRDHRRVPVMRFYAWELSSAIICMEISGGRSFLSSTNLKTRTNLIALCLTSSSRTQEDCIRCVYVTSCELCCSFRNQTSSRTRCTQDNCLY